MSLAAPGRRNLITDVPGILVGQAQDDAVRSGVTVVLPEDRAVCAADVRGGGPGTRETDALEPHTLVEAVDAVVLAGGSVYGLAAADAVTAWLGSQGRGFGMATAAGVPSAPIVPAAILYDLGAGGDKAWGLRPPYWDLGLAAVQAAGSEFALGSVGAGTGAMAGAIKGGLGSASVVAAEGWTVGALAAVNAFGSVLVPGSRTFWAAPFEIGDEFGGLPPGQGRAAADDWGAAKQGGAARESTTLAVVATDVALTPADAKRVAIMAHDGLARAIRPVHAPVDGDVVFILSTARRPLAEPRALTLTRLGALAADTLARAVARGVHAATAWPGVNAWRDL